MNEERRQIRNELIWELVNEIDTQLDANKKGKNSSYRQVQAMSSVENIMLTHIKTFLLQKLSDPS